MGRSISFVLEGPVPTWVRVTGNLDGTLSFELAVLGGGDAGALEAVFFDVDRPLPRDGFTVYGDAGLSLGAVVDAGTDALGRRATVTRGVVNGLGDFDLGVSFGPLAGAARPGRATGFTLAHATVELPLEMIGLTDFGLRFARDTAGMSGARAQGRHQAKLPEPSRGRADRAALEVIDLPHIPVRPLATDDDGGVVAVIDRLDAGEPMVGPGTGHVGPLDLARRPDAARRAGGLRPRV